MGIKKYIQQRKENKRLLGEEEKRFIEMFTKDEERMKQYMEEMEKIDKGEIPIEFKILKEEEWERDNPRLDNQKTDTNIDSDKWKHMRDFQDFLNIRDYANTQKRKWLKIRFVSTAATFLIVLCLFANQSTQANPIQFLIQVVQYIDGKIAVNSDVEFEEGIGLDYEIYQAGYMTEDYVLMYEEELDDLYRMDYFKDPNHFITITQASINDRKILTQSEKTEYQIIMLDDIEYLYNCDSRNEVSALYFTKDNTLIFIRGTIEKEEIFHIAKYIQ